MKKLILGTAQIGIEDYGINNHKGKISKNNSFKILSKAFNSGIRIIDTAESYGRSHGIIGEFHKKNPSSKFEIITKLSPDFNGNCIKPIVLKYIEILQVEQLHTLMFHSFKSFILNKAKLEVQLKDLKNKKIIKNIGVSVYTNDQMEQLLNEDIINVIQSPYNLLDNHSIRGSIFSKLKNTNKVIHTRSIFLQGLFYMNLNDLNPIVSSLYNQLEKIQIIRSKLKCTISDLALSYCLQSNYIDNVIIGVESIDQLNSNLKAYNYKLEESVVEEIDLIKVINKDLLNPSLWP